MFVYRLEMNSSLDQDFEEFRFTDKRNICKDNTVDDVQKFGMSFSSFKILNEIFLKTMASYKVRQH